MPQRHDADDYAQPASEQQRLQQRIRDAEQLAKDLAAKRIHPTPPHPEASAEWRGQTPTGPDDD